jgi:hypothetical protein
MAQAPQPKPGEVSEAYLVEDLDEELSDEPVPVMQQVLDNPFLLLFLGVAIPTVLYIVWGVMEILSLPLAQ